MSGSGLTKHRGKQDEGVHVQAIDVRVHLLSQYGSNPVQILLLHLHSTLQVALRRAEMIP